jgi:polyhydroxybutyrate depolymerase
MQTRLLLLIVVALSACTPKIVSGGTSLRTLNYDGLLRSYHLHVPDMLPADKAAPLVFVFHGSGGNGYGMESFSKFSQIADREGFIVVYPDAEAKNWNDGRECPHIRSQADKVDDVGFVGALITVVSKLHKIDAKRIYATGFSNGGILAHYLGAQMADRFAAVAPVSGGIAEPFSPRFKPSEPVSVFIIHGSADPMVPYAGGEVDYHDNGRIISMGDAVKMWTERNGITAKPETGMPDDVDVKDQCRVQWTRWSKGKAGTEILLYNIEGAGHTWPGGPQFLPASIIGYVCRDFDAAEVIWDFFKKHPKP